jgi:DNA-binding MarR family transcriptional regulator
MRSDSRSPAGEAATQIILSMFRAKGLLLAAGDRLTADEGLTSARWQVLGAIALADRPLTVPQIARRMGLTRQSVHATVNRLVRDGLAELAPNTDHRRSQLVCLTKGGRVKYSAIDRRQAVWVNRLAGGIGRSDLQTAARVIDELSRRLEAGGRQWPGARGEEAVRIRSKPEQGIGSSIGPRGESRRR